MAVGLGTGKNPLTLVLLGQAARLLQYETLELEDLDTVEKYLPILHEWEVPVYTEAPAAESVDLGEAPMKVHPLPVEDIAGLLTNADRVFVF